MMVADRAVAICRTKKVRLPHAIVWATAQLHALLLMSRSPKDFSADWPGIRVPYKAQARGCARPGEPAQRMPSYPSLGLPWVTPFNVSNKYPHSSTYKHPGRCE